MYQAASCTNNKQGSTIKLIQTWGLHVRGGGSVQLMVQLLRCCVCLVKGSLEPPEPSVGVNVSTFDGGCASMEAVWSSRESRLCFQIQLRKVFPSRWIGMSADELAALTTSKGTVELLSSLLQSILRARSRL